jgi:hypothetical protein
MAGEFRERMIRAYREMREPTKFLSRFFTIDAESFFSTEEVEIDVDREGEDIAIAVQDLSAGYRMISADQFTNKKFPPPVFKTGFNLHAADLFKRDVGFNPYTDVGFQTAAVNRFLGKAKKVEKLINRAIEQYASQILTTGTVTLIDYDGNAVYALDYKPKTTHFAAAGTAWNDSASVDILGDIRTRANLIRANSGKDCRRLLMGEGSFVVATQTNTAFKERFEKTKLNLGELIPPQLQDSGGTYHGHVSIGNYRYEIWTYAGTYKHPQTGATTKYLPDDKVVLLPDDIDFRALFGDVPRLAPPDARVIRYLPAQMAEAGGVRMHWNAWLNDDATALIGGVASRPLLVPTSIDAFGCIDTGI